MSRKTIVLIAVSVTALLVVPILVSRSPLESPIPPASPESRPGTAAKPDVSSSSTPAVTTMEAADAHMTPRDRWIADVVAWLELQGDAKSLIVASIIIRDQTDRSVKRKEGRARALALLRRATELDPDDPLLAWLTLTLCESKDGCDPVELETKLKELDPKNALGWMGELNRAFASKDPETIASAIKGFGGRERFELYAATLNSMLHQRILDARVPPPPRSNDPYATSWQTDLLATSIYSALPFPTLGPLVEACAKSESSMRESCRGAGRALSNSDTYVAQGVGLRILERTAQPGSESTAVTNSRRRLDWIMFNVGQLKLDVVRLRQLIGETGGEIQAYEVLLREYGIPLDPPVGWSRP